MCKASYPTWLGSAQLNTADRDLYISFQQEGINSLLPSQCASIAIHVVYDSGCLKEKSVEMTCLLKIHLKWDAC